MKHTIFLFDQDGTLTESGPGIIRCAKLALEKFAIEKTEEELRVFIGPPLEASFRDLGVKKENIQKAIQIYREEYETKGLFENRPYKGIIKMLQELKNAGYRLFVVTSKDKSVALSVLKHFDMDTYFDNVYGTDKKAELKKSKAELIHQCLMENRKGNDSAYMIGDTKYDILGAKANNIKSIAVKWGYGSEESIVASSPDYQVETVQELANLLKSFGSDYGI